jgi:hypothetical protein
MAAIVIKQVNAPLFGVVDSPDPEVFRSVFAAPGHIVHELELNEVVFDQIGNALGIHFKNLAADLLEFVTGTYHPNTDPPTGTHLGNMAEALSYLLLSRTNGMAVTRVITFEHGGAEHNFPMPDFFVELDGELGCVEVKSTIALDFLDLADVVRSDNKRRNRLLAPCRGVLPRREDALRQLGYEGEDAVPQLHRLALHDGRVLPFPADFGVAHVHLLRDGRLELVREHDNWRRLRTDGGCISKDRECWQCLDVPLDPRRKVPSKPAHVTLVEMHNEPGSLGLLGAGRNGGSWREAYTRWSEALWARDPPAVEEAQRRLIGATEAWLEVIVDQERDAGPILRGVWDRYLGRLAFERGLRNLARRPRFDPRLMEDGFEQEETPAGEPEVEELEQLPENWLPEEQPRRVQFDAERGSFSVGADSDSIEIRSLSEWWRRAERPNAERARQIARDLLKTAWKLTGGPAGGTIEINGLVEVSVGDDAGGRRRLSLGWRFVSSGDPFAIFVRDAPDPARTSSLWMLALSAGDPRCTLMVHPEGRGYLRIPRALVGEPGRFFARR